MKIKFLGTGGAFNFEKGTASALVTVGGKNILIDCGFSTILKIAEHNLTNIDYILITHLHADHVGSLPTLLPYFQYMLNKPIPKIIVPNPTFQDEIHQFLNTTYESKRAEYVPLTDFEDIGSIDTTNQHVEGMTSFAYYFTEGNSLIYYSGDISNADTARTFLDERTESDITVFHETSPKIDIAVHSSYKEVAKKLSAYDVYAYHVAKESMPADCTLKLVENYPEFLA